MSVKNASQSGFTLLETMLAMGIGSLLMLGAATLYPLLYQRSQSLGQYYQLDQLLNQTIFTLSKDLRRAGFCNGDVLGKKECSGNPLFMGNYPGEPANTCVILRYDLNRNGHWEPANHAQAESFGYRLRQGDIESHRGIDECSGSGWGRLLDPTEVTVTEFSVQQDQQSVRGSLFTLTIAAHWRKKPTIYRRITTAIRRDAL